MQPKNKLWVLSVVVEQQPPQFSFLLSSVTLSFDHICCLTEGRFSNVGSSARNGNLGVPLYCLKAKLGYTARKKLRDKLI
jgi:hypothetical protein